LQRPIPASEAKEREMGKHKDSYHDGRNSARRLSAGSPRHPNGLQGSLGPGGRYGYRKDQRRQDAADMAEARAARSPQEQLALLDHRLGNGVGAVRERARLHAQMEK